MSLTLFPDVEQGTDEWNSLRRGICTASVVGSLITIGAPDAMSIECPSCGVAAGLICLNMSRKSPTPLMAPHSGRFKKAANLPPVYEVADNETSRGLTALLAAERITGWTEETAMTSDMWRGVESEPFAREVYSAHYQQAEEVGFMLREEADWKLGYSPDGLVGTDGLIEIKAPRAKTHLKTILDGEVPAHYVAQCQAGLLVSGRDWIDFVSYVGGMPLFVKRVLPDPRWFDAITAACIAFETNVAQIVDDYESRVADMPKTERLDFELKVA